MKTTPYLFQIKDARQIHKFKGRCLIANEPGLGKTLGSLLYLYRHQEALPCVIVCPASLKYNWQKEAAEHFSWRSEILETTRPKIYNLLTPPPLIIINYDILEYWIDYLKRINPKCIIIDECQMIGSKSTKRTKAVTKLCKNVPYVLGLSGTPLTNRPVELYPILHILRPDLFPSFFPFGQEFCGGRKAPWGWVFDGATNIKRLNSILVKNLMIRRRKEEVLDELPEKSRVVIPFKLKERKEYDLAVKDFITWLREFNPDRANKAEKAEKLVQVGYLKRLAGELKISYVIKWINDFLTSDRKLVIYAYHKKVIKSLEEKFKKICVVIDGNTPVKERKLLVSKFQKDKKTRLFIGNIKAAGIGITLTSANAMAFAELSWTPGDHLQVEDRIHRIGQKDSSICYYLIATDTIEEKLVKIIHSKQKVLRNTLDGKSCKEDFDILDQLIKELVK